MPSGFGLLNVLELPMLVITLVVGMTLAIAINLMFAPLQPAPRRNMSDGTSR